MTTHDEIEEAIEQVEHSAEVLGEDIADYRRGQLGPMELAQLLKTTARSLEIRAGRIVDAVAKATE